MGLDLKLYLVWKSSCPDEGLYVHSVLTLFRDESISFFVELVEGHPEVSGPLTMPDGTVRTKDPYGDTLHEVPISALRGFQVPGKSTQAALDFITHHPDRHALSVVPFFC